MKKTTMNVQELATQLGVSLPIAYELVKKPGFPSIRIGARIVIPMDAYKFWLKTQTKPMNKANNLQEDFRNDK